MKAKNKLKKLPTREEFRDSLTQAQTVKEVIEQFKRLIGLPTMVKKQQLMTPKVGKF